MRRLLVPRMALLSFLGAVAALLGLGVWLVGDYFWTDRHQRLRVRYVGEMTELRDRYDQEFTKLQTEAKRQRQRLLVLRERVNSSHETLARWRTLNNRVHASLPRKARLSGADHGLMEELETGILTLQSQLDGLVASIPSRWPTEGWISSEFGSRASPWTGENHFHAGVDIANDRGTPVHAPGNATVAFAGTRNDRGGRAIVLNHGQGITTHYGHLSRIHVKKGDRVRRGQWIADMGNTGKSTNPHLHYEVRVRGVPIDPRRLVPDKDRPPVS